MSADHPPLQNRVDPFGALFASPARGTLMGNRGGRIHTGSRTLTRRRWTSRRWICCLCAFNNRHRTVWGDSYTELFFLDEVTALCAGHRPCFECRRADALQFSAAFASGNSRKPPGADLMDAVLHTERLASGGRPQPVLRLDGLPDGVMIAKGAASFAILGNQLMPWYPEGYGAPVPRASPGAADVLTPACIITALRNGYRPQWHATAGMALPVRTS